MPGAAPPVLNSDSDNATQALMLQAMMKNMQPADQQALQAALAAQARKAANKKYLRDCERKLVPALTNGLTTQNYTLNTAMTFNLSSSLNAFLEGIIVQYTINYTLATGTSAVYGITPAGKFGFIDTIEVKYNKSAHKFRPQMLRELALMGAIDSWLLPEGLLAGQVNTALQAYLDTALGVTVGANSITQEFFIPFNLISPTDARGIMPFMEGDTGIQVIINTPLALIGNDPVLTPYYPVSGTGHAISGLTGTVKVTSVIRDGDVYYSTSKLPFDINSVDGTFMYQIDQVLQPLTAGNIFRGKLQIQGYHYYVLLLVVDGQQSTNYATNANIAYLESSKDASGANPFWKYGIQTNLNVLDFFYLKNRLEFNQDLDEGIVPFFNAPVYRNNGYRVTNGNAYFDNTRNGWPSWRYGIQLTSLTPIAGAAAAQFAAVVPRIEPHVFFINPAGLQPV